VSCSLHFVTERFFLVMYVRVIKIVTASSLEGWRRCWRAGIRCLEDGSMTESRAFFGFVELAVWAVVPAEFVFFFCVLYPIPSSASEVLTV
jgi:hypothetical protein